MKFLHVADIHLDSPMAGIARRDPALAALLRDCTRRAFENVIALAIAQRVDFMLIAGDVYDGDWKNHETGLFFAAQMRALGDIPCVLIHGNHDAASIITKSLTLPPNVVVLGSAAPDVWAPERLAVAVHGQSFATRHVVDDLAAQYRPPIEGRFNIGLLHSSVEDPGTGEHRRYAPCVLGTLINKGYDYWALGHIHTRANLGAQPHPLVHFPGNPQGRSVRELGSRGVTMVDVDGHRVTPTYHATDVLRWAVAEVDAAGVDSRGELAVRVQLSLRQQHLSAEGRPLVARVSIVGATALHGDLLADPEWIQAECRNMAADVSHDLHIEKVVVATAPPPRSIGDVLALEAAFRAALDDTALTDRLLADFKTLRSTLPSRTEADPPPAAEPPQTVDALRALRDDAWQLVLHGLSAR